jgi:predicted nucleic acid-binding protein
VRIEAETTLQEVLSELDLQFERTPLHALFVAGKAFRRYRQAGGPRTGILPEFFIGAHAQVARARILTRDTRRYRTYFPEVELIAPEA